MRLLFDGLVPAGYSGNLVLDTLFGATIRWIHAGDSTRADYLDPEIRAEADRITAAGTQAYPVLVNGSAPLGALGYVRAARELRGQVPDLTLVFCPSGCGGTHAGFGDHDVVQGIRIGDRRHPEDKIEHLAVATARTEGWCSIRSTAGR